VVRVGGSATRVQPQGLSPLTVENHGAAYTSGWLTYWSGTAENTLDRVTVVTKVS